MNVLGIATLYIHNKFEESHQSFLLVEELFETLKIKNESDLKSDCSQDNLSLQIEDIMVNDLISLLGMKSEKEAMKLINRLIYIVEDEEKREML